VVVLGIGLGSVREMGLATYARAFVEAGCAALAFDHRHFGASEGAPRQLLDVERQLTDWRAAIAWARSQPGVDPQRVVVWGTSFGGGHAISIAAERPAGVVAALAQCPFTDGIASGLALGPLSSVRVGLRAVRDLLAERRGRPPVRVATAGAPGSAALMTAPDALPGFLALVPPGTTTFRNEVAARIGLRLLAYRPGLRAGSVTVPLWVGVCDRDSVAPPRRTTRLVSRAPRAVVRHYDAGHFEIYREPWLGEVLTDQVAFVREHAGP
jgi:pimeloyl-ACP methyl ester carboxylesterase